MKKEQYQKIIWKMITATVLVAVILFFPVNTFAIRGITVPVQTEDNDIISLSFPTVSEGDASVFDFILDPQKLIYSTDAVRYGGGVVEENATLLFHNSEGEYDFSGCSDWLTVTNQGTVPVQVTITARITGLEDIRLAENSDFSEDTDPVIYLALVDDRGNIQPLSIEGQTSVCLEMDIDYDTYSFGLMGVCNPNAPWQDISTRPIIEVTWYVEPLIAEQEDITIEEDISVEENIISEDDDIREDVDGMISEDLQDDNVAIDNSNGDNEENSENNSGEQDDTVVGNLDGENNDIDRDDIPGYDNSQNKDIEPENPQGITTEETEEKELVDEEKNMDNY